MVDTYWQFLVCRLLSVATSKQKLYTQLFLQSCVVQVTCLAQQRILNLLFGEEPCLDCQHLASSTPRSVRSLSPCSPLSNGNNTSSEIGLLGTGKVLSLVEQVE